MVKNIFDYHVANFAARNPHHSSRVSTSTSSGTKEHIIEDTTRSSERTENGGSGFGSRQGEVRMSSVVDSACSGAEWWIQIREEGYHADLGMPFHWDKDEQLRDTTGVTKFPEVSTVTYLTEHGAPTLVLEVRTGSCALAFAILQCMYVLGVLLQRKLPPTTGKFIYSYIYSILAYHIHRPRRPAASY